MDRLGSLRLAVLASTLLLAACASTGTRVSTSSDAFKSMADSQQWWCSKVGGCECYLDGNKTTCSLVYACVNSGNCKVASK